MVPERIASARYRSTKVANVKAAKDKNPLPFGVRLAHALTLPGNENGFSRLVNDLGVTRQAITKLLDGGSKEMGASNNARAARCLNVDPIWLATGEGVARSGEFQVRWHERRLLDMLRELPADEQDEFSSMLELRWKTHQQHAGNATADPFAGAALPPIDARGTHVTDKAAPQVAAKARRAR